MASGAKYCSNVRLRYLTQKEAIALDEDLFNEYKYSVDQLMELAGLSVATAVARVYPAHTHTKALIICGPGNNGGDGLVAARHMALFGYNVSVHYPKRTAKPLYENLLAQCVAFGVDIVEKLPPPANLCNEYHVLVDALFGFSFKPPVRKELAPAMDALIEGNLPVCSVDIPSGWDVEKGPGTGKTLKPSLLISLSAPKLCAQDKFIEGAKHFLGGRFLPPGIISKYSLKLPCYPGDDQNTYTLEAHLAKSGTLKKVLEAIKDLLVQATFNCDANGIHMQAMDSSHVTLVSLTLENDRFERYRCDRPFAMGIKLESFSKILKCAADNDALTMKAKANSDTITIEFVRSDQNKQSIYVMKLMNLDGEELGIPEDDFTCTVKLPSVEYNRICIDLLKFGDTMHISCTREAITFKASGDIASGNIRLKHTYTGEIGKEEEAVIINARESVTLSFACKYLHYFSKAMTLTPQVQLSMAADRPLMVEYRFPELGQIRYYLAPKIVDEDD